MVYESVNNEQHLVSATDAYMPKTQKIEDVLHVVRWLPRSLRPQKDLEFQSVDEANLWAVTALARRDAFGRRYRYDAGPEIETELDIQTWLLGPGKGQGRFDVFYDDESTEQIWRALIIHEPASYNGTSIYHDFWKAPYEKVGMRHKRTRQPTWKREMKPFLEEMLAAYMESPTAVQQVIQRTGHPYLFTRGLPTRSANRPSS